MQIVGVAEPDESRRNMIAKRFSIPPEHCFRDALALSEAPKFADAVINGTMDHIHVETTLPLLEAGYDVLLEKPFAVNEREARLLADTAVRTGRKVMVCFVLRYAGFYRKIKEIMLSGAIGSVIDIHSAEYVSYHHMSTSYVRGKWNNSDRCHSTMLLAKCCHDIDIITWLMSETKPKFISSFGSCIQYRPENAPEGSGTYCLVDCPYVDTCVYSAKRLYLDHPDRWVVYVWDKLENIENPTDEDRRELLRTSPYGRCIYKSDNNIVDHQSVNILFENGATGSHSMIGGAATGTRKISVTGTKGMIYGDFEEGRLTVSIINPDPGCEKDDTEITVSEHENHGGGDLKLVEDFVAYCKGEKTSVSCTSIDGSLLSHLAVFLADESMEKGGIPLEIIT
jgi:predicted dehydrogenase